MIVELNNPDYCELRAIEAITEARLGWFSGHSENYEMKIEQAVFLLLLGSVQRGTI